MLSICSWLNGATRFDIYRMDETAQSSLEKRYVEKTKIVSHHIRNGKTIVFNVIGVQQILSHKAFINKMRIP